VVLKEVLFFPVLSVGFSVYSDEWYDYRLLILTGTLSALQCWEYAVRRKYAPGLIVPWVQAVVRSLSIICSSASFSIGGRFFPRRSALRKIPSQAFALK
jgi:hypothetical protein